MQSALNLPTPPPELIELSHTLGERIVEWIGQHGPMPFDRYMYMCLYEPGLGYYVNGLHKFGADGDFITAPEQGDLFAQALARQVDLLSPLWGDDWTLLELGAGSGVLAKDLLAHLERPPQRYEILEPSAQLRQVQATTLKESPHGHRVRWLDQPPEKPFSGVIIANEVIDALPVKRFRWMGDRMEELAVTVKDDRLQWTTTTPDARLTEAVEALAGDLSDPWPVGFESELCVDLAPWLSTVTSSLSHGLCLFVDYGYSRQSYYHPERLEGTLVCHYRHRAHFDPFVWPGLTDLSAFVDFDLLAKAGTDLGLKVAGFTTQAEFVLASGVHETVLAEPDEYRRLKLLSELKRLTLPGEMGEKFKLMALGRSQLPPMSDFFGSMDQ